MPVLAGAAVLAAIAWVYLVAARGGYWRTDQRLPAAATAPGPGPAHWPSVVAVVPARDEAAILPVTLPSLLTQDYPGEFSVVLVDDASTDGTAATAAALGGPGPAARAPRIVPAGATPPGWAGKVHAMAQGLRAAGECDFVLFTDADISYAPGSLAELVRAAVAAVGGLTPIRDARIDDVALGRLLKRGPVPARCWLGFTTRVRSRRPYPELAGLWDMVARSAYTQLRYSPALLTATLLGLVWLYAVAPAAAITGLAGLAAGAGPAAAWCLLAGLAAWALMAISYLPVLRLYRLRPWRAAVLPLIALLYAAMTADSARRHHAGRGGEWKGRTIPVRDGPSTANRR